MVEKSFFLMIGGLLILFSITLKTTAQNNLIFDYLKSGEKEKLLKADEAQPIDMNLRNNEGYTLLQWLIKYYVDYDLDRYYGDNEAHMRNILQNDAYRGCLVFLLSKGPDLNARTPEGYTTLQWAVVQGKYGPTDMILDQNVDRTVRDPAGNTLLHLSTLADNDATLGDFWQRLFDQLLSEEVNLNTPNYSGQTPIVYYFSQPRVQTRNSNNLIDALQSSTSLRAKDMTGMNAVDYAKMNNGWASFNLDLYLRTADIIEKDWEEVNRKFQAQVEENNRLLEEYERRKSSGEGVKLLTASFTETYDFRCNINYKGEFVGSGLEVPITLTVTPDEVWVSSLEPYYGGFKVESSGYELIGGEQWEIYYFEQTANNSTYIAIGFPVNIDHTRAIFLTSSGFDGLCNYY